MKTFTFFFFFVIAVSSIYAQRIPENMFQAYQGKGFIENKGQVRDLSGKPNNRVKYIYNRELFNLELNQNGFSYEFFQAVSNKGVMDESGVYENDETEKPSFRLAGSSRIDILIEGANKNAQIVGKNPTGAVFNFYAAPVATNKVEQVKAYNTVIYEGIYPGIDLVFNVPDDEEQTQLHYDFIVHPGADPTMIKLKYSGATSQVIDDNGLMTLNTPIGFIIEGKPFSYLESNKEEIESSYMLNKNEVMFHVGDYNRSQTLVIDPTLIWGTYYGGPGRDDVSEISLDSKKHTFITGNTLSTINIATSGAYQTTSAGLQDLYVAKFKVDGKLEWASYFGGSDDDISLGLCSDNTGNVIIEGETKSTGLATIGQIDFADRNDGIIAKFSSTGIFQWSTYKGGDGNESFRSSLCDKSGNIYLVGYSSSDSGIATSNAYQTVYAGGDGDCMIAKLTPSGNIVWCTYFGGPAQDRLHAIDLTLSGHLLVQGTTSGESGLATPGVHQLSYGGGKADVLLAEFDTGGTRIWCTYFGGAFEDRGRGVESDSAGNIFIGGFTTSANGIATPGAHQEHWTEGYYSSDGSRAEDAYLAKFTATGQQIWGTYYGGSGADNLWGMTIDRKKKLIYAVGSTISESMISTPDAWQVTKGKSDDGFFSRWDYDGDLIWGSYFGAAKSDQFEDVEVDKTGFIYLVGKTSLNELPSTPNVHQTSSNGDVEALVYKFYPGPDCYDYNEPNNNFSASKRLSPWYTTDSLIYGYSGAIVNGSDEDWFYLKVKSDNPNILIILSDLTYDYNINFYNAQHVLIMNSLNTGTINDTILYNNLAPGNYYFEVAHTSNQYDAINCYRLQTFKSHSVFLPPQGANRFSPVNTSALSLQIFPNPAANLLSFNITSAVSEKARLTVYDMPGNTVKSEELFLQQGYQTIDLPLNGLPAGAYRLTLKSSTGNWIATFVKQSE